MNGYFLFHGMLVRLTCSILELSLCVPRRLRGKVFRVQWKLKMMSFRILWMREFLFSVSALTLKRKIFKGHGVDISQLVTSLFHVLNLYFVVLNFRCAYFFKINNGKQKRGTKTKSALINVCLETCGLICWNSTRSAIIPEDVFVPVVQCVLFSNKVIVFPTQKDYSDVQLFSFRLAVSQRAPSWHMELVHYQLPPLLFLSAFPGGDWSKSL